MVFLHMETKKRKTYLPFRVDMHFPTATAFLVGQLAKQACANLVFAHYM